MSTKQVTSTSANFDPSGMGAYNLLQPNIGQALQQNMNDPFSAMAFNSQLQQGNKNVLNMFGGGVTSDTRSMGNRGISPTSPLFAQRLRQTSSATRIGQNQMYNNLLLSAGSVAQGAATAAGQYQPIQTGGTTTTTGGGGWGGILSGAQKAMG